jgi:hypothetical protein
LRPKHWAIFQDERVASSKLVLLTSSLRPNEAEAGAMAAGAMAAGAEAAGARALRSAVGTVLPRGGGKPL